jgi:hypothetical protein
MRGAPTGFWVALPDGWVGLDVDPKTSAASARQLVEAAARKDETIRQNRVALEQMMRHMAADAADSGAVFCACYFQAFDESTAVQASFTVGFHSAGDSSDPAAMLGDLDDGSGRRLEIVDLEAGSAVRRTGRGRKAFPGMDQPVEFLSHQYFVPVPNAADRVALLTFASPSVSFEEELGDLFESMARGFEFTWRTGRDGQ